MAVSTVRAESIFMGLTILRMRLRLRKAYGFPRGCLPHLALCCRPLRRIARCTASATDGRHPANARGVERTCRADTNTACTARLKRTPLASVLRRSHDDRPARGVKARRTLRLRTMVAFHKEFRVSPTIAGEIAFRNKIPETRRPGCLCNG